MKYPFSAIQQMNGGDGVAFCSDNLDNYNRQKAIKEATRLYDINQHPIKDKTKKPDKKRVVLEEAIKDANGVPQPNPKTTFVKLERNPLDISNYIIEQKTTLVTGAGVGLDSDDTESKLYKKVKLNWDNAKLEYDISQIFSTLKKETQVALILFGKKNGEFGYKIASPNRGDTMIPIYDEETEDFIGFQRTFKLGEQEVTHLYYKDANELPRLKVIKDNQEISDDALPYQNLPIIYWEQPENECANVAELIYALEDGMNTFFDTARYFADPILVAIGKSLNLPAQTDSGKVFNVQDEKGDMKFITPENPTEMRKLHFDMLEKYIFLLSHAVRLDAESLKGLGKSGLSGEAIERLMTDAYMYATNQQNGEFGKGVQRLVNFLTKEHATLTKDAEIMNIKAKFRKYSLRGEKELVELYMQANGGLPVIGEKESIVQVGLAKDVNFNKQNTEKVV